MARIPENPTFQAGIKALTSLGKSIRQAKKSINVNRFNNVQQNVNQTRRQFTPNQYTPTRKQSSLMPKLSNFGTVTVPYGGSTRYEKFHPGIDVANKIGTRTPSFTGGTVKKVVGGRKQGDKGYGNYVLVQDKYGNFHRYSHLNQSFVKVGQDIQRGQPIGTIGNTGQTYSLTGGSGAHLDYRIFNAYNKYINPSKYLQRIYG